jgi:hypothetical protein
MSPYRTTDEPVFPPAFRDERGMTVALGLLVAVSLARIVGAVATGETFGVDATGAFLLVVVVSGAAVRELVTFARART